METHTLFVINDQEIFAEVELPWTVNEAARLYYQIQKGDLVSDKETALYLNQYLLSHFHVFRNDQEMNPKKVEEIPLEHGHSIKYRIYYDAFHSGKITIENLCLLELYGSDQKNNIAVQNNGKLWSDVLGEQRCTAEISTGKTLNASMWLILSVILLNLFW